jgi:hypothetical protein
MPAWKDYQEEAAAYYRQLGLSAETDATIDGARGRHKVDVAVRGNRAGVDFLWIVECKYWNRAVPKEVVATLSAVIQDSGADRGIVLSRKGYQSGAPMLARLSNITLTSLDELRINTEDEYVRRQCALLSARCEAIYRAVHRRVTSTTSTRDGVREVTGTYPAGLDGLRVIGRTAVLEGAIKTALGGQWPLRIVVVAGSVESHLPATDFAEFLAVVDDALSAIEGELAVTLAEVDARTGHPENHPKVPPAATPDQQSG